MTRLHEAPAESGHGYCVTESRRVRNCPLEICQTLGECEAKLERDTRLKKSCPHCGVFKGVHHRPLCPDYGVFGQQVQNVQPPHTTRLTEEQMEVFSDFAPPQGGSRADGPLLQQMMPLDSQARKNTPLCTGALDYFPLAFAAIARLSKYGNDKHNPGQPLHWSRGKSSDHADCILRHLADRGVINPDTGESHSVELAWRSLALLQEEEEKRLGLPPSRGSR